MRVALVEADTVWEDPAANRARLRELLPAADVAILPEFAFTGFTMAPWPDPDAETFLVDLARERGQAIVAGYIGEGPRNVAVAVDAAGAVLARYAKLHPFTYADEHLHYRPGDDVPVFELGGVRAAMLICYDLRFPEVFREAALRGAELFFVIANWPTPRVEQWRTLLRARAIENQAFVLAPAQCGRHSSDRASHGRSLIVDPWGRILAEAGDEPAIVIADCDPDELTRVRASLPALSHRRL